MTLRLVSENPNVSELPVSNLNDIAAMARKFADDVEAGTHGDVGRVVLISENGEGINIYGWGDCCTAYELMGLFESAKLRVFADDFVGD